MPAPDSEGPVTLPLPSSVIFPCWTTSDVSFGQNLSNIPRAGNRGVSANAPCRWSLELCSRGTLSHIAFVAGNDFPGTDLICGSVGRWLEVNEKLEGMQCCYGCNGVSQNTRLSLSPSGNNTMASRRTSYLPCNWPAGASD